MEANKIFYFRDLSMITKQELLYNMERTTYEEGQLIFHSEQVIDKMIIIQSGVVEIAVPYDRRVADQEFIIERLGAGAIIFPQSYVTKEICRTDIVCQTGVSCFELTYERLKTVMERRADMQQARKDIKQNLMKPNYTIALDYILHNNAESPEEFDVNIRSNALKVKFKNAVMQVWSEMKHEMNPRNI